MTDLPILATEADLRELLNVTDRTVRNWRDKGLEPVGSYLPSGSRTAVALYNVDDANQLHRTKGNA